MYAPVLCCVFLVGCARPIPEPPHRSQRIGDQAADLEHGRIGGLVPTSEVALPDGAIVGGLSLRVVHGHDGIAARVGSASWQVMAASLPVLVRVERAWLVRRKWWRDTWYGAEPLALEENPVVTVPAGATAELALTFRPVRVYTTYTTFAFRVRLRIAGASYEVDAPLDVWRLDFPKP